MPNLTAILPLRDREKKKPKMQQNKNQSFVLNF